MKATMTALTLASALVAGTAFAASVSVEQDHYGSGIGIDSASHYVDNQEVMIDGANLDSNLGATGLYKGSK